MHPFYSQIKHSTPPSPLLLAWAGTGRCMLIFFTSQIPNFTQTPLMLNKCFSMLCFEFKAL